MRFLSFKLFLCILLAGAAYWVAPLLFYCWFLILPQIPSIITPLDLLFGSSRIIAIYATLFTGWFILSIPIKFSQSLGKQIIGTMVVWFIVLQMGFLFAIATNLETWQWSKHRPGLASDGLEAMNTVFFLFTLPVNMLSSFWFIIMEFTDKVSIIFQPPERDNNVVFWVDLLKIPWWILMGWLILKIAIFLQKTPFFEFKPPLDSRRHCQLLVGWCGYLWLITKLNWFSNYMWLEESGWFVTGVVVWSGVILIFAGLFSGIFFRGLSCLLNWIDKSVQE